MGEQLGHLEYLVDCEKLHLFRQAVAFPNAQCPNIAAREHFVLLLQNGSLGELESVTHTDRYFRPPIIGRRVQVTGWIRERRRERQGERLVVETFAVDEIGTEIMRSRHTFRSGTGRSPERLGRRPSPARTYPNGEELPPVTKIIEEETIEQFESVHGMLAGPSAAPVLHSVGASHTGAGLASGMGLAATVAPGELGLAYLHELLDRRFGADFRQGGTLTVNFRRPMYAGDSLTAHGVVTGKEPADDRVAWRLQVWLENRRGEAVITGDARVTVPSPLT